MTFAPTLTRATWAVMQARTGEATSEAVGTVVVGVVAVVKKGKERVYNLEADKLKTVHDWVKSFEKLWSHQLDRIQERAERRAREKPESPTPHKPQKGNA